MIKFDGKTLSLNIKEEAPDGFVGRVLVSSVMKDAGKESFSEIRFS